MADSKESNWHGNLAKKDLKRECTPWIFIGRSRRTASVAAFIGQTLICI